MREQIGILLRARISGEGEATFFFFCLRCARHFDGPVYKIWPVYKDQFPQLFGQRCMGYNCSNFLQQGTDLFDSYNDLTNLMPEDVR